jgi:hypothetical protein
MRLMQHQSPFTKEFWGNFFSFDVYQRDMKHILVRFAVLLPISIVVASLLFFLASAIFD